MTIVKKKAKKKNFSIIDNEGLHSRTLSWQATGLWAWFMSKPDDWEVNLENLCSSKTNGKDSTLSTLAELEDAGYLIYQRWRNSTGRFESAYTVFESPEQLNEWKEEADPQELSSIARVSKGKGRKKAITNQPQWSNHGGITTVENPQWINHSGLTTVENPQQLNIEIQRIELLSTELISTESLNPPNPLLKGGKKNEAVILEQDEADSFLNLEQEASTSDTLENQEDATSRSNDSIVAVEDKCSAGGVVTLELCDDRNKTKKQKEQEMADCFLAAYLEHKPSNFTTHQRLTSEHLKKIKALVKVYGDRSLNIFVGALTWCREQNDDWWRKTQFSLSNLMSNGKIEEYADKHFHALETDRAYCDRVEGRAISKDSKRSNGVQVFNEQGEEITGAAARAAQAVAGDPLLALFLEQI